MQKRPSSRIRDIGSSIEELVDGLGIRQRITEYEAVLQWPSIVGDHIGKAAHAVKIVKGVLIVKVNSSTWRNELSLRKKEIVDMLNQALGAEIVKDIRFQ